MSKSLSDGLSVLAPDSRTLLKFPCTIICLFVFAFCSFQSPYLRAQQAPASNAIGIPFPRVQSRQARPAGVPAQQAGVAQQATLPMQAISSLQCSAVPTSTTASFDKYYYLTTDIAGQLGINWIGSVNATAESQQVVLLREYRKYAQCPTTDGSGQLQYGAAFRATVLVSADNLQAGLNFAVVAASATLKSQSSSVLIEDIGFNDSQLDTKAQTAMQDVAATGLTVLTFGAFNKDLEAALTEATTASIISPYQRVAFVPNQNTIDLTNSVATSFGLSCMAKGWGCVDAQSMFPGRDANSDAAIQQLYAKLTNGCAGVNNVQQANAQNLLSGIATVPACHR